MSGQPVVLDASALLAWLQGEPGADEVNPLLKDALVSAPNWFETVRKLAERGVSHELARAALPMIEVVAFTEPQAAGSQPSRPDQIIRALSCRSCLSVAGPAPGRSGMDCGPRMGRGGG